MSARAVETRWPTQPLEELARWGQAHLESVVAIDSQSDESSPTLPSSEGQRVLCGHLRRFFDGLGFESSTDAAANLLVRIPATPGRESAPALALMVHVDTARGTKAIERLHVVPAWDGARLRYPANERLGVSVATYPSLAAFVGEDVLHGPGDRPFGLDDKLGLAELMTLARALRENPTTPHGPLYLVFRPDEEIGRMAAVEGLADELARRGVRYGYTVDGIAPFEINVENFEAATVRVRAAHRPLPPPGPHARLLRASIGGVNTHGATAHAEGYRNATVIVARALTAIASPDVAVVEFATDAQLECNATISLLVDGPSAAAVAGLTERVWTALAAELEPLRARGGYLVQHADAPPPAEASDAAARLLAFVGAFLSHDGERPRLSEESAGRQGYSNPHRIVPAEDGLALDVRLRDFDAAALARRGAELQSLADARGLPAETRAQYVNMGPSLAAFPELSRWAEAALAPLGRPALLQPIRGGTGVDPFLARGIPVANLGTGYFAPESEKELTTRQTLARHALWLFHLCQVVADRAVEARNPERDAASSAP